MSDKQGNGQDLGPVADLLRGALVFGTLAFAILCGFIMSLLVKFSRRGDRSFGSGLSRKN